MAVSLPSARARGGARAIGGVVDVWRVDLSRVASAELAELLCPQERMRAERIVDGRRRELWSRSRATLRALLSDYVVADPRALSFEPGPHGKLALREDAEHEFRTGAAPDVRFNLSHSGQAMLVAVTAGREVGVDIERARERHTDEFLRAWTIREARLKCLGVGLDPAPAVSESARAAIWTAELDGGPQTFAAVALAGLEECELRYRHIPPKLGV